MPINTEVVPVDQHCEGERWRVNEEKRLAKILAIIAMGQQRHAAKIVQELLPAEPLYKRIDVFKAARKIISSEGKSEKAIQQRDGLIFEIISWIAALKTASKNALFTPPHLSSTTQGIDGLILELENTLELENSTVRIERATICEDKCSQNPRKIFQSQTLKTFDSHHKGERDPELLASAGELLDKIIKDGSQVCRAAEAVLDRDSRRYRAALTIEEKDDSHDRRKTIFKGFDSLKEINQKQRLAAVFVVDGSLRDYFEDLSQKVIEVINNWEEKENNV